MTTSPLRRPLYEGGMSPPASPDVTSPRAPMVSRGVSVLRLASHPELAPAPGSPPLASSEIVAVVESPPPEENVIRKRLFTDTAFPLLDECIWKDRRKSHEDSSEHT